MPLEKNFGSGNRLCSFNLSLLPRVRPGGYLNPWMALAMQVPEHYPDPERLYRPMLPRPQAVERMLETMRWVQ